MMTTPQIPLLHIQREFSREISVEKEPPKYTFPFSEAYPQQNEAVERLLREDRAILEAPTGAGKTAVYLSAAFEGRCPEECDYCEERWRCIGGTLIITPRNFLQDQVRRDYSDGSKFEIVEYRGREHYDCGLLLEAGVEKELAKAKYAPCRRRERGFFEFRGKVYPYPCRDDCEYYTALRRAREVLRSGGFVVVNHGNFWVFKDAYRVIIDEGDEILRSLVEAVTVSRPPEGESPQALKKVLEEEREHVLKRIELLEAELKKVDSESDEYRKLLDKIDRLERRERKLSFFIANADRAFYYQKRGAHYVELLPDYERLLDRLFRRWWLVSATPPRSLSVSKVSYTLPFRRLVFYTPVAKLTEQEIRRKGENETLEKAARFIVTTFEKHKELFGANAAIVYSGNLHHHGKYFAECLKDSYNVVFHKEGKLEETIERFKEELSRGRTFLVAVGIEYGGDFKDIPLLFVTKVPYSPMNERLRALEKKLGRDRFKEFYEWDALSKLVQVCGRVQREPDSKGVTYILDAKFGELYEKWKDKLPVWFKERLVMPDGGASGEAEATA